MKLLFAVIGLASCGFAADARAVASACGPDSARFDVTKGKPAAPVANNDAAKARVYVIVERFQTTRIGLDGAWVGAADARSWISFLTEPGEHHLCSDWQPSRTRTMAGVSQLDSISLANFTAEAGKVYYFRARSIFVEGGGYTVPFLSSDLEPTSSDEGQFLIASFSPSDSHLKK